MNNVTENKNCLACGGSNLIPSLNLGNQPLANNLTGTPIQQQEYPLAVALCEDCCHLQLTHSVNPRVIYSNYLYVAGTSQTIRDYSNWFAGYVVEKLERETNNVLDIGCNDGTQLDSYKALGLNTFGIDPAQNIYPTSSIKHNVLCDYFGPGVVDKIEHAFDAITAQNVFAHNPNPLGFLETCNRLMSDHTLLFIQTSQADMVLNNEFDTIYHEHINFFNANSMNELSKRADLNLIDVIKTPIHGNSYIFVLSKTKKQPFNIVNILKNESKLMDITTYKTWEKVVHQNMWQLRSVMKAYVDQGYKIIGYGAAAKGNTLLNYIKTPLELIVDDSPLKQDLYCPGHRTPIKSVEALLDYSKEDKILFMPLAWNFFTEISQRIKKVRNEPQDLFLKYFPEVEVK